MDNTSLFIIGNWKMHGSEDFAKSFSVKLQNKLLESIKNSEIIICPPFLYLSTCHSVLKLDIKKTNISLGAQNCASEDFESGAYTGEVSTKMLKDYCKYIIIGHSERRKYYKEDNEIVKRKAYNAHYNGLIPIICVGETLESRKQNLMYQDVAKQLEESIPDSFNINNTIIAYEPIWAIGTGNIPTISEIDEMHKFIAYYLMKKLNSVNDLFEKKIKLVYGGSVKSENVQDIVTLHDVDGVLVGGASLNFDEFWRIIDKASNIMG